MNAPIHPVVSRLKKLFGLKMGCYDIHRLLFDYAQGSLPADLASALEKHLQDCRPCLNYVETYRQTIKATCECGRPKTEMPADLEQKLKDFIAKL